MNEEIIRIGSRSYGKTFDEYWNRIINLEQENKQLKEELKSANEEITWWSNRFNAVERDNRQLKEDKKKAIEYIKEHKEHEYRNGNDNEYYLELNENKMKELLEILGGKENEHN